LFILLCSTELQVKQHFKHPTSNMLSSTAYAAFDVYASVYESLETMTIKWDTTTQKLIFTSNLNKLKFWILNTFIACILCTGCCVFIIITREIFYPSNKVGLILILFQIILSIVGFLWLIFALSSFLYGDDYVTFWNILKTKVQDHCSPRKSIGDVVFRNQSVKLGRWK